MINRIKLFIGNIKRKRCVPQMYSKYLLPGEYVFDDSLSFLYHKNDVNASMLLKNNYAKITMSRSWFRKLANYIIKFLCFQPVFIAAPSPGKKPYFQGTLFQIGTDRKEHKIFNLQNNEILLLFPDIQAYDRKIRHYKQFKPYFPIPDIMACNKNELLIIERFIPAKEVNEWTHTDYMNVMADVFQRDIVYLKQCKESNAYLQKSLEDILQTISRDSHLVCYILGNISVTAITEKIPFVELHGDLWSSNILIDKSGHEKIYYIDWEKTRPYMFYYDIFYLLLNECFIRQNYTYAEKYLSGELDEILSSIFQIFGFQYEPEHRFDYLYLALLNQYIERWANKSRKEERRIAEKWKFIFQKLAEMKY
ncbi:MAG TPA: phosphotransferase [Clostridiales bacterium]|nr:phosphotransferase [Clostridiales bacterium]